MLKVRGIGAHQYRVFHIGLSGQAVDIVVERGAMRSGKTASYTDTQDWLEEHYGFWPPSSWIAHCKEIYGLFPADSPHRLGAKRVKRCPPDKQPAIAAASRHFGMLGPDSPGR